MGKNATSTTIAIFGSNPNPNQASSSGAMATFGIVCEPTISGYSARSSAREYVMQIASGMPISTLMTNPTTISKIVTHEFASRAGQRRNRSVTMAAGDGSR